MNQSRKTAIVILTYNNLGYTKDCIESIRKYTPVGSYELIVVDNNSSDGTREWLKAQKDIKLLLNDFNAGFPKGCNMGIALAEKDSDILLLNNDTVVTPRWLDNLKTCLYSDERIGAVGAVCNQRDNLQNADFSYKTLDEMQVLAEKNNVSDRSRWEEKVFLIGFCILIKREVLDRIGPLDEGYSPGYVEDNDLSMRIIQAGYKLMLCHDVFVHHYLGTEFRKDPNKFFPVLWANRKRFREKWGFEVYHFDDVRHDLLRLISPSDRESNILHIGCGLGVTLLKARSILPNARLYGLEWDRNVAAIAGKVVNVSIGSPEKFPMDFPKQHFDYILAGNILEQLEDPERFLKELKVYLKKDGYIICALQNIMHYKVIRNILNGSWLYSTGDNLRKQNRSFFTLKDIHELFSRCGYINPYIFHWFSVLTKEDEKFVKKLCEIGDPQLSYQYTTYNWSLRFQNSGK